MNKLGTILIAFVATYITACGQNGTGTSGMVSNSLNSGAHLSSYPNDKTNNLRISLTDAPTKLKNVFVNVDHAELFVNISGEEKRVLVASEMGLVDLLTLRHGVLLPMHDLSVPVGTQITGIRLVLKGENNHSIKLDDSRCEMQTPSGQQSGIKIHLSSPFTIGENASYSMVMDFDAAKSVVVKGNGDCLLKPVLKLLTVTKEVTPTAEPEAEPVEQPVTEGENINTGAQPETEEPSGFEEPPVEEEAELITPEELWLLD
jgi:hypothetical protein